MSVHIDIGKPNQTVIVEVSGTSEDIAAEFAAAAGLVYAQLSKTEKSAGADFRAALTAMTREDSQMWSVADSRIDRSYGRCVVYMFPGQEEHDGKD